MTTMSDSMLMAADGMRLHIRDFYPSAKASNRLMIMHGLGEHCGRYQHVAEFFCARGFAVRSYDHRGHGLSGGARGDLPHAAALLDDAVMIMRDWNKRPDLPQAAPFLLGHSMGGLFAAELALSGLVPLSGLILSSPALALPLNALQKLLLTILTVAAPGLAVPNGLKRRYLSHDRYVVAAYSRDPLVHGKISARLLNAMRSAVSVIQRDAASLRIPTLLLFSGDDHLVDAQGSEEFFSKLAPGIATRHRYDALYHEIFNENKESADAVFADLARWLNQQIFIAT